MSANYAVTAETARSFAKEWIEAWNSHDLEQIIGHYTDDVVLTSPVAAKLLNIEGGTDRGKPALTEYFRKLLEAVLSSASNYSR